MRFKADVRYILMPAVGAVERLLIKDQEWAPTGVVARTADGKMILTYERESCPLLHGEAVAGENHAFACSDGILVFNWHIDHFHTWKVSYPPGGTMPHCFICVLN